MFLKQTEAPVEKLHLIETPKAVLKRSASVAGKAAFSGTVDGSGVQSTEEKMLRTGAEKMAGGALEVTKETLLTFWVGETSGSMRSSIKQGINWSQHIQNQNI